VAQAGYKAFPLRQRWLPLRIQFFPFVVVAVGMLLVAVGLVPPASQTPASAWE
jgi:hypothetical protein